MTTLIVQMGGIKLRMFQQQGERKRLMGKKERNYSSSESTTRRRRLLGCGMSSSESSTARVAEPLPIAAGDEGDSALLGRGEASPPSEWSDPARA
jgi:hypothetical protein